MDRHELLRRIDAAYSRLEEKQAEIVRALSQGGFDLETGWYDGHDRRDAGGKWRRDAYPFPVIGAKGLCDVEIQFDRIDLSAKLTREAALACSFAPLAGYSFEAYGTEDYLADYYHPGQALRDLRRNISRCGEAEIGFSFSLPFDIEGQTLLAFVSLLKREGFYF